MTTNVRRIGNPVQKMGYSIGLCAMAAMAAACSGDGADDEDDVDRVTDVTLAVSNPSNNQRLSIIHRCYMPGFGDGDHMSTNKHECPSGTDEGQMFYVPSNPGVGTHALYRLYKAAVLDHMDSTGMGEGGYATEFTLGYPFDSSSKGLCALKRWYKPNIVDHLIAFCGEDPSVYGYNQESIMGYGYNRYGKSGETLVGVTGNSVQLKANLVAGGAIAELWWNGKQFVNDFDYGRQIQTAISLQGGNSSEADNPTEAGDNFGWKQSAGTDGGWAHGSPLLSYSTSGKTLSTTTSPLQWTPGNFGGDSDHPVRWRGTISKTVTLDFMSSSAIKYVTKIYFPMAQDYVRTEVVTAYVTPDFTRFYLYDAASDTWTEKTSQCPAEGSSPGYKGFNKMHGPQSGGIIVTTADGSYALGGYHRDPGYPAWYQCGNFTNRSGSGKYGDAATKWSIFGEYPDPTSTVAAGVTKTYTNYLAVGTFATARSAMRQLYLNGY